MSHNNQETPRPATSLAQYCLDNVGRSFDGKSYSRVIIKECRGELTKGTPHSVYRDFCGTPISRKKIADLYGVSGKAVTYAFEKHDFNHEAAHQYLASKAAMPVFRHPDGGITTSGILAEYFHCSPTVVINKYSEFSNNHVLANQALAEGNNLYKTARNG